MNKLHARRYYGLQTVNALFRKEKFGRKLPEEKLLLENIMLVCKSSLRRDVTSGILNT
jgi:hypothetical protein